MARTIYFPDGSMEVLFHPDFDTDKPFADLERIIRERLEEDTAALLREVARPPDLETYERELDSYSEDIRIYRDCLIDVRRELDSLLRLMAQEPRKATQAKIQKVLNAQIKNINNEL